MSRIKYLSLLILSFILINCSSSEESIKEKIIVPEKISMLFITQPSCPSCEQIERIMQLEKPQALISNYFELKKVYLGEKIPANLPPPNGTPTIYFLGSNHEILIEPIIGEKNEEHLMMFLEDALLEFKNLYHVDLLKKNENNQTRKNHENTIS